MEDNKFNSTTSKTRFLSPSIRNLNATPVLASKGFLTNFTEHLKSERKKSSFKTSHLFGSNLELSSTGNTNLVNDKHKINRTPTISVSPNQTVTAAQTPINTKQVQVTSNSGGGCVSSSKVSFVNKHLAIQRRKTIHDIINFDIFSNFINSSSTSPIGRKDKKFLSSTNSIIDNKSNNSLKLSLDFDENQLNSFSVSRDLIKQGNVLLLNQYGKQERHLFLFNDLLIISKQKNENHNKLKYRVLLSDIWLADCFDTIYWQYKQDTSIVIGWPPAVNYIADFKDPLEKEIWVNLLKDLRLIQKQKEENLCLNIKISYNTDNSGTTEPTQYSQCYTKTVQVRPNETAQEIVNRCRGLFNLEQDEKSFLSTYQLWLKISKNEPLIPLIGHEFPFAIKMNYLRESGRSVEEDDNSYKFVLIDRNSKKQHLLQTSLKLDDMKQNLLPVTKLNHSKENETDRLHRLRKKMFWNKNSVSRRAMISVSNQNLDMIENGNEILPKKPKESLLNVPSQSVSIRSNSLHHVSYLSNETKISNGKKSNNSSSAVVSTLKPFYNKLKKSHLFGVKLEKMCGPYTTTNNQLPVQLMNLMEKVAVEGTNALMIFRKSASAKIKKMYRDKIDSNQIVDFNEMNVHVAALLLKEYLRDYPDGIIDYHLFNDCISTLKITDSDQKLKSTKLILNRLPKWNYICLKHFMCIFHLISLNSTINKMDTHNISVCVAPSIFHKLDRPNDVESSFKSIAFVEFLINNIEDLFGKDTHNLFKKKPLIKIEINSDSSSQISKSNESIYNRSQKTAKKMFNLVTLKSKPKPSKPDIMTNSLDSNLTEMTQSIDFYYPKSESISSNERRTSDNKFIFEDFVSDDDYEPTDDDDEDIIYNKKFEKKKNLFKIKSTNKNLQKTKILSKHDLSSNTLSVDSGLSVPTTSDLESEKSNKCEEDKKVIMKQFSESDAYYDLTLNKKIDEFIRKNSKRFSSKSIAPLAPEVKESKSTETNKNQKTRPHASRKSIVKIFYDEKNNFDFGSYVDTGLGDLTNQTRHSSTVYVPYEQVRYHFDPVEQNSKDLVVNLFNDEEVKPIVKRSLSLKNDADKIEEKFKDRKSMHYIFSNEVQEKPRFVSKVYSTIENKYKKNEMNRKSIVTLIPNQEVTRVKQSQNRVSIDATTLNLFKKMDDNNNSDSSKNKSVCDLELAGVTWSVPNIRKQFERCEQQKSNLKKESDNKTTYI